MPHVAPDASDLWLSMLCTSAPACPSSADTGHCRSLMSPLKSDMSTSSSLSAFSSASFTDRICSYMRRQNPRTCTAAFASLGQPVTERFALVQQHVVEAF